MLDDLIIEKALLLLERNMQVGWHFTGIFDFFTILETGELRFSKLKNNNKKIEFKLSNGADYFLSTSRTKNPKLSTYVKDEEKFDMGAIVRFEIDLRNFKVVPIDYFAGANFRARGMSEYEERIISSKVKSLELTDNRIKRIDILIKNSYEINYRYKRKYNVDNINALKELNKQLNHLSISKKTYLYSDARSFLYQNDNTIDFNI